MHKNLVSLDVWFLRYAH